MTAPNGYAPDAWNPAAHNGAPAQPATTAQAPSASDLLMGQSRKNRSASFRTIGAQFAGTISSPPEVMQARDPETGEPKFYRNSTDPIWQIVLPCQTEQRDQEKIPGDDGIRYLYIGGSKQPESKSMHVAVASAVRAAGATALEVGGVIQVAYVADGPKSPNASAVSNPPKQYQARYTPPPTPASQMLGFGDPAGQQQPPAQATPTQATPTQTAPAASVWDQAPQQQQQQQSGPAQPAQAASVPPVTDETGTDPRIVAGLAHLPVAQQNAFINAGMTYEELRNGGFIA